MNNDVLQSIELDNAIVYTKFGLNITVHSEDMEQNPNSDANQGS